MLSTVPILRICIKHMISKLRIVLLTVHVLPGQIGHPRKILHQFHNLQRVLHPQPVILPLGLALAIINPICSHLCNR